MPLSEGANLTLDRILRKDVPKPEQMEKRPPLIPKVRIPSYMQPPSDPYLRAGQGLGGRFQQAEPIQLPAVFPKELPAQLEPPPFVRKDDFKKIYYEKSGWSPINRAVAGREELMEEDRRLIEMGKAHDE
jgi:hypothetical protein